MKKVLFLALLIFSNPLIAVADEAIDTSAMNSIVVQEDGRLKPFLTFATNKIWQITGKKRFERRNAIENVFILLARPKTAYETKLIPIEYKPLVDQLGFEGREKYYSLAALDENPNYQPLVQAAARKQKMNLDLSAMEKKLIEVANRATTLNRLLSGQNIQILPPLADESQNWMSLSGLDRYPREQAQEVANEFRTLTVAFKEGDQDGFNGAASRLDIALRSINLVSFPDEKLIKLELLYEKVRPFQKAWMFYFIGFLLFLFVTKERSRFLPFAWTASCLGFVFHTGAIILRVLIGQRAPVSNMYESLVFLAWSLVLIAILFSIKRRSQLLIATGAFVGFLTLVVGDLLPIDASIGSLVPVLRSNFWLTIHVLTIVSSYGAFALACGLGHYSLGLMMLAPQRAEQFGASVQLVYRVIQVGLLLLTAGTILGGVWANESWGRFWGWDPKETWALISILGYLVIVHGRFAGWIRDFGTAVCSILGFMLILMTYYGVNFILGQGLHSYGQGSGGEPYVLGYLGFEVIFLGIAALRYHQLKTT